MRDLCGGCPGERGARLDPPSEQSRAFKGPTEFRKNPDLTVTLEKRTT